MRHTIRDMENILILRINQRLKELGISAQRASRTATGAKETLRKILDGTTKNPRIDTIKKIADTLNTTPEWLMGQTDAQMPSQTGVISVNDNTPSGGPAPYNLDVPILRTAPGSRLRASFNLATDTVGHVRRPPALFGAKDIYALYVEGDSMYPQYSPGNLVFVHPHKPANIGDAVIVQAQDVANGEIEATIGILEGQNETSVTIMKHKRGNVDIPQSAGVRVHKILTTNELFGV